ncbi:MAG: C39 family peptidase [Candidatus Doudnabacteria bacterium]|nr:C39 family peptidase [Candidatus Doudnabacteria bacterium]
MKHKGPKIFAGLCMILLAGAFAYGANKYRHSNDYIPPVENSYKPDEPDVVKKDYVLINVPFTSQAPNAKWSSQAPNAKWSDPRQQDGCEEASVLMSWLWINGKTMTKNEAEKEILAISDFEDLQYGNYHDTEAKDTVRFMKDYFGYDKAVIVDDPSLDQMKDALRDGKIVLIPANGQRLGNPNFTNRKNQFITNDPGTRLGEGYVYDYQTIYNAMVNYPSGQHLPQDGRGKAMIVIQK